MYVGGDKRAVSLSLRTGTGCRAGGEILIFRVEKNHMRQFRSNRVQRKDKNMPDLCRSSWVISPPCIPFFRVNSALQMLSNTTSSSSSSGSSSSIFLLSVIFSCILPFFLFVRSGGLD